MVIYLTLPRDTANGKKPKGRNLKLSIPSLNAYAKGGRPRPERVGRGAEVATVRRDSERRKEAQ